MIDPRHLLDLIIRPVLRDLNMASPAAERLLLCTAACESGLGRSLTQVPQGPGRGIYQMEVDTIVDLYHNYFIYRPLHRTLVDRWRGSLITWEQATVGNLHYATAMARVNYWRRTEPLPEADDIEGLGRYYEKYWKTYGGEETVRRFVGHWQQVAL